MANHISHASLPYPIKNARYTVQVPYLDADGDPTDPTTPDTEVSQDGGAFADAAEEMTTISGSNGLGFITLTGAETNNSAVGVCAKVASGPKATLATLYPRNLPILAAGTASAGASGSITLASSITYDITGCFIRTTGGTGGGGTGGANNQARRITAYNTSTQVATVTPNWETTPDNTTTYDVLCPEGITPGLLKALNPTTAGRTLDVSTGGEAGVDWANVGSPTTTVDLSGTTIAITQRVDVNTIKTQTVICAASVTVLASVGTAATSTAQTGDSFARIGATGSGLTSLALAADLAIVAGYIDTEVAAIKTKTDFLPSATAGAAGGLLIAGSNAATIFATLTSTGAFTVNGVANVSQTGDNFARLGAPSGVSVSADILSIMTATNAGDVTSKTADSGAIVSATGTVISGTYTDTASDNDVYWITAPVTPAIGGFGLRQNLVFNLSLARVPTQIQIKGYWNGAGQTADVYALNARTGIYDKLTNTGTNLASRTTELLYTIPLPRDYYDDSGGANAIVTLEFRSASTNTAHRLRLDRVLVYHISEASTAVGVPTPADIWAFANRTLTTPGSEPAGDPLLAAVPGSYASGTAGYVLGTLPAKKGAALSTFPFTMVLSSDHVTAATGKTVAVQISKDGGAFATCTNSPATEVASGWYKITLTSSEMDAGNIALRMTATLCDTRNISLLTEP